MAQYSTFTQIENTTTRVQVQAAGPGSIIAQWSEGWRDGLQPAPDMQEYDERPVYEVVKDLDRLGFAVWTQFNGAVGFGLRGKITRIDLIQTGNRVRVNKYPYGWTLGTPPISSELKPEGFTIEAAVALLGRGWTIRTWPGGARAWFGRPKPIRTRHEIQRMRDKLSERFANGALQPGCYQIDLAFEM